jgi:hypothetical protein
MKMVEDQTRVGNTDCIKFIERKNQENYLRIISEKGCWSYVGRFVEQSPQSLSVQATGCVNQGIVAHEIIHALGN